MNILPMPSGVHTFFHVHKDIVTIAYLLEGECSVFHGEKLENETVVKKREQIFIPSNVPHAPYNRSDQDKLIPLPELENNLSKIKKE